jgi:hypothetical protein
MAKSIFLSHTWSDKAFVRQLAADLSSLGVRVWVDEAEIRLGDSLIERIRAGIDASDFLAVVLSPESVQSPWVQREIDVAMNQEIEGKRVKVLPLLHRDCELPGFLKGKLYADFTDDSKYSASLRVLLRRLEVDEGISSHSSACRWCRLIPSENCESAANDTGFCDAHLALLQRRAINCKKANDYHKEHIRAFVVAILSAAGALGAEVLIKHWDFIWAHVTIGGMFPPGFYWDSEQEVFLGRPEPDTSRLWDYGCAQMNAGLVVDSILRRLPD